MLSQTFSRMMAFYRDGFRSMTVGKTLWIIAIIKLIIMFGILRVFFFPRFLEGSEEDKKNYVSEELIQRSSSQ